jgi:DNA-binding CsgD family transcriptional regulator
MEYRKRIYYTDADKELMWDRWQAGDSLHSIARLFDRNHPSVQGILARTGGIRPPKRKRAETALTLAEREEISRGIVAGHSMRSIASSLGRAPSTVSRELRRNGGGRRYRANKADEAAWDRAKRPKTCKKALTNCLVKPDELVLLMFQIQHDSVATLSDLNIVAVPYRPARRKSAPTPILIPASPTSKLDQTVIELHIEFPQVIRFVDSTHTGLVGRPAVIGMDNVLS